MESSLKAINDPLLDKEERLLSLYNWEKTMTTHKNFYGNKEINNHIHTIYSFSPYTPAMAALKAFNSGLEAAGSVDHDSISAAQEMLEACRILGIGGCTGFEVRVSLKTGADDKPSPFANRKINNPDSEGIAYMTVQGIPTNAIPIAADFLKPIIEERLKRTKAMAVTANIILREAGLQEIDFDRDIYNESKYSEDGSITERHLLAAAAKYILQKFGKGASLTTGLKSKFGITIPPKIDSLLADKNNQYFIYDLLGVLKSEFLPKIFIQPGENECIPVNRVTTFAQSIGAIPSYAYLGDVGESPTGDKRAEKFEDDFIEELFEEISRLGFKAVTYMPPRNTLEQLLRVQELCAEWDFMEISGVDINSPRQSFNCPEVLNENFRHLINTTWALIAHERLASVDKRYGLFSADNPLPLNTEEKLAAYASFGKSFNLNNPDESAVKFANEIEKGRFK